MRRRHLSPERWQDRAEECRVIAEQMDDAQARASMLQVADGYERLAHRVATLRGRSLRMESAFSSSRDD